MSAIVTRNGAPDLDKSTIDYEAIQDPGHGHSVAGWSACFIVLFGTTVSTVANVFGSWFWFWGGGVVIVVGIIVGIVLQAAGFGAKAHRKHLPAK